MLAQGNALAEEAEESMCMNGKCGRCGAACKAPEPKLGVTKGGPVNGDGLGRAPEGVGRVAKRKAAEAARKARAKRF
jgi:hypothetical protein